MTFIRPDLNPKPVYAPKYFVHGSSEKSNKQSAVSNEPLTSSQIRVFEDIRALATGTSDYKLSTDEY